MTIDYKIAFWVLLAVILLAWVGVVEMRMQTRGVIGQADAWLFEPTNVTDESGQQLSRATLIDRVVTSSVQAAAPSPEETSDP
jgi:cell division protein FtsL